LSNSRLEINSSSSWVTKGLTFVDLVFEFSLCLGAADLFFLTGGVFSLSLKRVSAPNQVGFQ
jgi:hypothetical protein